MSVTSSDIRIFAAANMPEDNSSTVGGAVNTGIRLVFEDIVATDTVKVSGSDTADTGNLFLRGRSAAGSIISESVAVNGTGFTISSNTYERILDMRLDTAGFIGSVTTYDSSTETLIASLQPGVSGVRRPFYDFAADAAGGSIRVGKEKGFVSNLNEVNALLNASLTEVSSGLFAKMQYAVESGTFGAQTLASRTGTPNPTGITATGNGPINFPATDLDPQTSIGFWMFLEVQPGDAAANDFVQISVEGSTT